MECGCISLQLVIDFDLSHFLTQWAKFSWLGTCSHNQPPLLMCVCVCVCSYLTINFNKVCHVPLHRFSLQRFKSRESRRSNLPLYCWLGRWNDEVGTDQIVCFVHWRVGTSVGEERNVKLYLCIFHISMYCFYLSVCSVSHHIITVLYLCI